PSQRMRTALRLRGTGAPCVATLTRVVMQCYYRDDRVVRSLGLEARAPFPKGHVLEHGDWSLLDPVRERAIGWRKATGARGQDDACNLQSCDGSARDLSDRRNRPVRARSCEIVGRNHRPQQYHGGEIRSVPPGSQAAAPAFSSALSLSEGVPQSAVRVNPPASRRSQPRGTRRWRWRP